MFTVAASSPLPELPAAPLQNHSWPDDPTVPQDHATAVPLPASSSLVLLSLAASTTRPPTRSTEREWEEFCMLLSSVFTLIMVLMCIAGVLMNSVSLWIFTSRQCGQQSINVLLAGLSASDMCLCFLAIPVFSLNQFLPDVIWIPVYVYPITLMAQTSSVWMLVSIAIERWLAVCHPFAVRIYCTRQRAILTIVVCVLFSIGYNFVRFWEYTIEVDADGPRIVGLLRGNQYYMVLYQNIALLLTQFILPLFVLGVLNIKVAKTVMKASARRREMGFDERREHRTAKMMVFIVIVFLFCYVLSFLLNVLEIFNSELFRTPFGFLLNDVNNVLVVLNSSSSFIFYTKYSSRYRRHLRKVQQLLRVYCYFGNSDNDGSSRGSLKDALTTGDVRKSSTMTMSVGGGPFQPLMEPNKARRKPSPASSVAASVRSSPPLSTRSIPARKNSDFIASIVHRASVTDSATYGTRPGSVTVLDETAAHRNNGAIPPSTSAGKLAPPSAPNRRSSERQAVATSEAGNTKKSTFRRWLPMKEAPESRTNLIR